MGLKGVDVASYQKSLTPSKMTTTDFIIVKFTQGVDYLNQYAAAQYGAARDAGKLLGAYHYAEGGNAVNEARYFIEKLGDRVGECILALDWEGVQNPTFGSGKDVTWCLTWLNEVYRLTGVRAFVYMSKSVCRRFKWARVAEYYPLWCAQYASNSRTDYQNSPWTDSYGWGAWSKDTIRQYSSRGNIAGYAANIDINMAYLTADEWRAMAKGSKTTTPKKTTFTCDDLPVLKRGSSGKAVMVVQSILGGLDIDGSYGPKTQNAVITFQSAHDLETDSVIGPDTWRELLLSIT